jgi:hypothetical protein
LASDRGRVEHQFLYERGEHETAMNAALKCPDTIAAVARPRFAATPPGFIQRKSACDGSPSTEPAIASARFGHDFSRVWIDAEMRETAISFRASTSEMIGKDTDKDEPPQSQPQDAPKEPPKSTPSDASKAVTSACGGKSLASSVMGSDKRMNGSKVEASLGATEFGNTSKLGADFSFSACKVGETWRFQLSGLVVPIASKVQDVTFRKNVESAGSSEVTKTTYPDVVSDLSPTTTATFSVSCGNKKDKDKVMTYSPRKTYWKQQFVIDHEAFHRKNWVEMYKKELIKAESDIGAYSIPAADAKNAAAAVAKADPDLTKYMTDAYQRVCDAFTPRKESRAYDDGAPAYQKLVDEINARAAKEKW